MFFICFYSRRVEQGKHDYGLGFEGKMSPEEDDRVAGEYLLQYI